MQRLFDDFSEVENEVKKNIPSVLYKYRNFKNKFHVQELKENAVWLANPQNLNDPHDIRIPVKFDVSEVNHPVFFEKLKNYAVRWYPNLSPDSRDFQIACENKLELIKLNPKEHFEKSYKSIVESDMYNSIGVFSMTENPLNETMWAYYANDLSGFCIGYDTVKLLRKLKMSFSKVCYKEEPFLWSFLTTVEKNETDWLFLKHTKWAHEEEFRIINMGIESDLERKIKLEDNTINEVIVGQKISSKDLNDLVDVLKAEFDSRISLFKIEVDTSSYGLIKKTIKY